MITLHYTCEKYKLLPFFLWRQTKFYVKTKSFNDIELLLQT